jgi:parallel beta-helix repeat protein
VEKTAFMEGIFQKNQENRGKAVSLAIIIWLILGIFVNMVGIVVAPIPPPHNIWGAANEGILPPGIGVADGKEITSWIDGVSYGNTIITGGTFDLYTNSDMWGDQSSDSVKDGGYDGDIVLFFLDYDPMDYYLNVSHNTFIHEPGEVTNAGTMFFNRTDQAPNLTTLRLLKINEIVLDPVDGMPQYVIIYDPGQHLGINNITDYYLQKDNNFTHTTNGEKFDFLTHVFDIIDMGNGYYYINLTYDLALNATDELKLVWKSPYIPNIDPAQTGPGNGTDIVVDRVEWGNYTNHINISAFPEDRDYDNTTLLDFIDVSNLYGTGASMIRADDKISSGYSGNGTDTDSCFADFKVLDTATPRPSSGGGPIHNIDSDEYFHSIQTAVDDSDTMDGHTITVAAGTYNEDVEINKSISIFGDDCNTTTICGMVTLNASAVDIRNFKIENPGATSLKLIEVFFTNIQNLWLEDNDYGISCVDSNNVTIQDCLIRDNIGKGIEIWKGASGGFPDNITAKNNKIINNTRGVDISGGNNCNIINNTLSKNREYGLYASSTMNSKVYHNNIINNMVQAYDDGANLWDNGYPSGGNFWSDYRGDDLFSGPNQGTSGNDEIGDTNYSIDSDSIDNYPFTAPMDDYIFLYEGWNLISIPFIQSDTDLHAVLNPIGVSYDFAQWYNTTDVSDHWKTHHTSKPPSMNDLESLNHQIGFWIHIPGPDGVLFQYSGTQPSINQEITLKPGWNLVGYPSLSNKNRTEALNNIDFGTDVDSVWTYNGPSQKWVEMDEENDYFEVGKGYWIHSKVTETWIVPL